MRRIALLATTSACVLTAACLEAPPAERARAGLHIAADTLMGVHFAGDPDDPDLDRMMDGHRGFTVELVYADAYDDGQADHLRRVGQHGLTVILRVDASRGQNAPVPGQEDDLASFFVNRLIPSLGDTVSIFVLGNEPNLSIECEQAGGVCDPGAYSAAYRRVRDAIHGAYPDRDLALLVAGMSPGGVEGVRVFDGNDYYRRVLLDIGAADLDGIAMHGYGGGDEEQSVSGFRGSIEAQLAVFAETGHGGAPVFITEMNRVTDGEADEGITARFLRRAYEWINAHNASGGQNIVGACWFVYAASDMWSRYSLRWLKSGGDDEDWRADSDVWHAFRSAARAGYPPGRFDGAVGGGGGSGGSGDGGDGSGPTGECACRPETDNVCLYGVRADGCAPTWPGGYCDPNGDGDFSDADWDRGWYEHRDRCGEPAQQQDDGDEPAGCECRGETDNICLYGVAVPGCDPTWPGGYCDPNGDGDFTDADWDRGWYEHRDRCG